MDSVLRNHVTEYFQKILARELKFKYFLGSSVKLPIYFLCDFFIWRVGMLDRCVADIQISSVSHEPRVMGHNPRGEQTSRIQSRSLRTETRNSKIEDDEDIDVLERPDQSHKKV